jgi:MinD superfamily P-loop ATPase
MNIAIASGKGGTGKTTIAVNLARCAALQAPQTSYLDCDVEEPNGHLFLKPRITRTRKATVLVPVIDDTRCVACGECVRFCQYKALVRLGTKVMLFPELCHGCGGCALVCTKDAVTERTREIGVVETGRSGGVRFVHGKLNIGEAMSPPLIRRVLDECKASAVNIIDAPPGTSCPAIAAMRGAGFVLLVTEPTPFGLNDLSLALDVVRELGMPHGVVVNRWQEGSDIAEEFCAKRKAAIVGRLPDSRAIAEVYSRGELIIESVPGMSEWFAELWSVLRGRVRV